MPVHGSYDEGDDGRGRPFVDREQELSSLRAVLRRVRAGEARLVSIEGPAGIGKTALVRRFLEETDGLRAVRVSGEESEAPLPYGVVAQIATLRQVRKGPDPLAESGHGTDPHAVGSALVDLLSDHPDDDAVVVVVDDAQWADGPSLSALVFAVRRLRAVPVLTIVITREAAHPRLPAGLRRLLADDDTVRLVLRGLGSSALRTLGGRLGVPLAQRAATRLHEHTEGNPRYARELLEQVPAEVLGDLHAPLPAPRSYELPALDMLSNCPMGGRLLTEAAAVLGRSCALHEAARLSGVDEPLSAAEEAVAAKLLTERPIAGGLELRFPHPLMQAAVYRSLGPAQRARLHMSAAEMAADGSARLRHRFLAADRPDDDLANAFANAGQRNASDGQWAEAADHLTYAARLSTGHVERVRHTTEAFEALLCDGQVAEARMLGDGLGEDADPASRGYVLGAVALVAGQTHEAVTWLARAWQQRDRQTDPALAARIAEQLAFSHLLQGQGLLAIPWAERALQLAPHRPCADLIRTTHLLGLAASGRFDERLRLTATLPDPAVAKVIELDALLGRGLIFSFADEFERGVNALTAVVAACANRSIQFRLTALAALSWAEFHLGRWDDADRHAEAATVAARDADQAWLVPIAHGLAALVPAARGEWERAAAHVEASVSAAGPLPSIGALTAATAQAHLATVQGDTSALVAVLEPLTEPGQDALDPALLPWREYLIEALIAAGHTDRANDQLDLYEELAATHQRRSAHVSTARLRGSLHAASDEPGAAESAYQRALQHAADLPIPFDQARLGLDYGTFLHSRGKSTEGIGHIEAARTIFEQLGAQPHVQRCDEQLGYRERRPVQSSGSYVARLTPQEQAVARLVAQGLTNRQAAQELVLSVKTIEYHLRNTYAKLGVTSRGELAIKLAERAANEPKGPKGPNETSPQGMP